MAKCIVCLRNENDVMLVALPVETKFGIHHLEVIGNAITGEFMCLPCIGFQIDLLERELKWLA